MELATIGEIAFGVAGGLVLFGAVKGLLELPAEIAAKRAHERRHREFIGAVSKVGEDLVKEFGKESKNARNSSQKAKTASVRTDKKGAAKPRKPVTRSRKAQV